MSGVTFRVYPEARGGLYFKVRVHPTRKAMQKVTRTASSTSAVCISQRWANMRHGRRRMRPLIGVVHFRERCLTAGVIGHEMLHATFHWARCVGIELTMLSLDGGSRSPSSRTEERVCYAHGRMTQQAIDRFRKLRLVA